MIITSDNLDQLGAYLQTRRKMKGLAVKELAKRAGLVHQTIFYAEASRNAPRLGTLLPIAEALGLEIEIREKKA